MEVRARERLIGALVLVVIVVLLVPEILKGRAPEPPPPPAHPTRSIEVPIGSDTRANEEQELVPEPALPEAAPGRESPSPRPTPVPSAAPAKPLAAPPVAARKRPDPPPTPTRAPAAATGWAVQLGAFSNRSKAEQLVSELKQRRYAAFLLEYRATGQVLYRVRVGPEQDRGRAEEIAARLAKDGFEPVVARHP